MKAECRNICFQQCLFIVKKNVRYLDRIMTIIWIDQCNSNPNWRVGILRYFNPVGAHKSGLIDENPRGVPNNLFPIIMRVAMGRLPEIAIFGSDYATQNRTGIRVYIHATDLVNGHLKALNTLSSAVGANIWNLGSGVGWSVLQMIGFTEQIIGKHLKYNVMMFLWLCRKVTNDSRKYRE